MLKWIAQTDCAALLAPFAGKETVNTLYGTRVAVLAGDFLFAQASWLIASLENIEVRGAGWMSTLLSNNAIAYHHASLSCAISLWPVATRC